MGLSSRERVLAAMAHTQPDRTPRAFWAEPPTMTRLFHYLGHNDEEKLLTDLGIDIRRPLAIEPKPTHIGKGVYRNFWGEQFVYRETEWGPLREDMQGALHNAVDFSELEQFPWPTIDVFDYSPVREQQRKWEDFALLYGFADVWERPALVRGWENMLLDMVDRPEWAHYLCRIFTDFYMKDYTRAAEITNGRIDLYLLLTDLGTQRGPLISLAMFREFVAPYLKEMIDCIHGLGGKALYHSCGDVRRFIPDLIKMGVDILDPIQPVNEELSPERLKSTYGEQLVFHGGIDTQGVLPGGTPAEVRATATHYCNTLGENGGYILCPAHLFQPDVPPENILAMYDVE